VDKRKCKGELWYKVKWLGWPDEYNSWVWREDINSHELDERTEMA